MPPLTRDNAAESKAQSAAFIEPVRLAIRSPHLARELARTVTSDDAAMLDDIFPVVMAHGGEAELDFIRDPDVSFNPRPARIPLILIQNLETKNGVSLAAGILSCIDRLLDVSLPELEVSPLSGLVFEIAMCAQLPVAELEREAKKAGMQAAAVVALAQYLDRCRHLHQSNIPEKSERFAAVLENYPGFLRLSQRYGPAVEPILVAWYERFQRFLSRQS